MRIVFNLQECTQINITFSYEIGFPWFVIIRILRNFLNEILLLFKFTISLRKHTWIMSDTSFISSLLAGRTVNAGHFWLDFFIIYFPAIAFADSLVSGSGFVLPRRLPTLDYILDVIATDSVLCECQYAERALIYCWKRDNRFFDPETRIAKRRW